VRKRIKGIKAVLFDHDDTLVATKEAKWAHHKFVASKFYGKELSDDDILPHWGKPFPELVCLLYGTDNVEEALANNASCHEDFPKVLLSETIPTLEQIHSQGKLIGILTATSRFSFEHDLTLHKIPRELIDYTQTADDTPFHKPDPRVFGSALKWLAKHHIAPNEVLYVGDSLHDMRAAQDAGLNFIGVETGLVTAEQFSEHAVESIPTITALSKIIK
jgi:phosphoglycolate phosphatase-like HAD superfamily hydrolase